MSYGSLGTCCGIEVYELSYGAFVDLLAFGNMERIGLQHPRYNYPSSDWLLDNASDFYVWVSVGMGCGIQYFDPSYTVCPSKMLACYLAMREQYHTLSTHCPYVECGEVWHVCGVGSGSYGIPPRPPKPVAPRVTISLSLYDEDIPF